MIFVGDIAHPFAESPAIPGSEWGGQPVIANLEGAFKSDLRDCTGSVLFNDETILEYLNSINVKALCLANNHITDVDNGIAITRDLLRENGIDSFGAGGSIDEASQPAIIKHDGKLFVMLGFGWATIQCRPVSNMSEGVNPFNPRHALESIRIYREKYPDAALIIMPHWNYEMELYPQPAHRQFAMAAIDAGASAVIGHHTHRVSGIEVYKGQPIVYSLGNWWLPQGIFYGGNVRYEEASYQQLAFEWDGQSSFKCYWFIYDPKTHNVTYEFSENLEKSKRIASLTPFFGMSHSEYKQWFKANRVKNKLLPVYADYRHSIRNCVKDQLVRIRHPVMLAAKKILKIKAS